MNLTHKENENRFYLLDGEVEIGYIGYSAKDENSIFADTTVVHKEFGGKGYARKLVDGLAYFARMNKKKIVPNCSYVVHVFEKYPEAYKDVAQSRSEEDGPIVETCEL